MTVQEGLKVNEDTSNVVVSPLTGCARVSSVLSLQDRKRGQQRLQPTLQRHPPEAFHK